MEEIQLTIMLDLDEATKKAEEANSSLSDASHSKQLSVALLTGEKGELEKKKEKLLSERLVASSQISQQNLDLYEGLRKKKRNLAITSIIDETCSGCGTLLTAAEIQAAKSTEQIVFCPSCGRILYAG
jgi:predicted  nucleic acid-binding Zn-ribbon protein